ncbi:UDP-glucose 6-dehydrogenase 1 [Glycine soja]|uniref:UDP-glucose 6-dehydrogenase 1 n=1 Tax=Glycine soja TaxID=3848 RepID=A0A445F011_GLYSO|nr:UDP-glucose 6-dehydrogenase 1 [Glycine soja]
MLKICCIGAGYVGGPTMAVIAMKCPKSVVVTVVDISLQQINAWNNDHPPIYEPGLDEVTEEAIERILTHNNKGINFTILSNPEFLAKGTTIEDLFKPDRVLIWGRETPQGQKLAASAFMAQRITSVNAMSALCETIDADVSRCCTQLGQTQGLNQVPECQCWLWWLLLSEGHNELGVHLETSTIDMCKGLLGDKAKLSIYDPQVTEDQITKDLSMRKFDKDHPAHLQPPSPTSIKLLFVVWDAYDALKDAHGACILTEWDAFKKLD